MAVPKPMLTEFGIHYRLESCVPLKRIQRQERQDIRKAICANLSRLANRPKRNDSRHFMKCTRESARHVLLEPGYKIKL